MLYVPKDIVTANNDFALEFYKLASEKDGNIAFSPIGMYTALSMLREGARENTAAELQQAIWLEPDAGLRSEKAAKLMSSLNRYDEYSALRLANSVWLADGFEPSDSYADIIRGAYHADIGSVDFADPDDAVPMINAWASNKTNGKISNVLAHEPSASETSSVLINAAYFKGMWATAFSNPYEDNFWPDADKRVTAEFIATYGIFNYTSQDGVRAVKLPYKEDGLYLVLIWPGERNRMHWLESIISTEMLQEWQNNAAPTEFNFMMPKFEITTGYDLIPALKAMGIRDAFDPEEADLSIMADLSATPGSLYVDKAIHEAFVDVSEDGVKAHLGLPSVIDEEGFGIRSVVVNHPFIFLIQDESGTILFMGRMSDPP